MTWALKQLKDRYDSKRILQELDNYHFSRNVFFISSLDGNTYEYPSDKESRTERNENQEKYDQLNKLFQGSYIGEIYNELDAKYGICQARCMKLFANHCYSYHQDFSPRIHIPVNTNEDCIFIVDNHVHRMRMEGWAYLLDTTRKHSAINMSEEDRTHLVFCLKRDENLHQPTT